MLPSHVFESPRGEQQSVPATADSYMQTENEHGDEEHGIHRAEEMGEEIAPVSEAENIEADFAEVPLSTAEHFFVDVDPANPCEDEELVGLEAGSENVPSITKFLTLPTVAARASARVRKCANARSYHGFQQVNHVDI